MSYRSDIDALAAREAALSKEVADKAKEHDEVSRLLDEARGSEAAEHAAEHTARRKQATLVGGLALLSVGIVAGIAVLAVADHQHRASTPRSERVHGSSHHVYSCAELLVDHGDIVGTARQNFLNALTAKGLEEVHLDEIQIGDWPGLPTVADVDKRIGRRAAAWDVVPYVYDGIDRQAIAGEIIDASEPVKPYPEFVSDGDHNVWHVVRAPRVLSPRPIEVDACPWGCWGDPPSGGSPPRRFRRLLWLLPQGRPFRGDVVIEYDEPVMNLVNVRECAPPA